MLQPSHYAAAPTETLSTAEAARLLKVHAKTVIELIVGGDIPAARIGKGYVMLRRDVLALVERRIASDTAQRLGVAMQRRQVRQRGQTGARA